MQNEASCKWIKSDGAQCKETKLVPDAPYCYRHYWQALWATTEISNNPLPTRVNWEGLFFLLLPGTIILIGLIRSPGWVLPIWLNTAYKVINNPELAQNPSTILFLLGQFASGFALIIGIWLWTVWWCDYPLRPKTRRAFLLIGVVTLICLALILLSSTIVIFAKEKQLDIGGLFSSIAYMNSSMLLILVFYSADNLKPKLIETWGFPIIAGWAITNVILSLLTIFWLQERQIEFLVINIYMAIFGIFIGYALLTQWGRNAINRFLTERVAVLADAMRPIDARILGLSLATSNNRRQALTKALDLFSNLTPLEQQELEEYIFIKRRPSIFQTILGIISIVLSAFLLEAPAQQVFIWFACDFLKFGVPLCPK